MMIAVRAAPLPSVGKSRASETTKPFDREASEVTRASQFIHPVSNPTKSPNAVREYRYAPPGSLKWLAASAKQRARMKTGSAKISGAQSENGPRSLYDSEGSRKTPLPMTALMHIANCEFRIICKTQIRTPNPQDQIHRPIQLRPHSARPGNAARPQRPTARTSLCDCTSAIKT